MSNIRKLLLAALTLTCTVPLAFARPVPAGLFADHAVLQREKPVPVWGKADPGEKVAVEFVGQTKTATADKEGKWMVKLDPMQASSESRELTIKGGAGYPLVIKDILVGEVWLASGQSNMAFTLSWSCTNAEAETAAANFPQIRQFHVPNVASLKPLDSVVGTWQSCSPETVGSFSAVAYFFARDIHRKLGIPVGIVNASWPGTRAESWTSREALDAAPVLKVVAEKQISDMENMPADQAAYPAAIAVWEAANGAEDKENLGFKQNWAAPDFDDAAWKSVKTPCYLAAALTTQNGGIVWFRKVFDFPAASAGKPLNLSLGWGTNKPTRSISMVSRSPSWAKPRRILAPGK